MSELTTTIIPPISDILVNFRPGLALGELAGDLGPLADLTGTWIGTGLTLVELPDFDSRPPSTGPKPFRVLLNDTVEILEFSPIGAGIPNRGSIVAPGSTVGQPDINIFGLRYLQRIADAVTHQPLHIEPGFWLNVPPTTIPALPRTLVRQGVIPHGNSFLALGTEFSTRPLGPQIGTVDSTPIPHPGVPPLTPGYLDPLKNPQLPPGFELPFVKDLNLALKRAIQGQIITKTVTLSVSTAISRGGSTDQVGGIVNMPFDVKNANATRFDATFWIETVSNPGSPPFLQLQYSQTAILDFLNIGWPHISVATLIKQ
jgi:hypothetical protein